MPTCALTSRRISAGDCHAHIMGVVSGADLAVCREHCAHARDLMATTPFYRPAAFPSLAVEVPAGAKNATCDRRVVIASSADDAARIITAHMKKYTRSTARPPKPTRPPSRQGAENVPASSPTPVLPPTSTRPPAWLADTLAHVIAHYPVAGLQGLKFLRQVARASFGFDGDLAAFRTACEAAKLTINGKARPYVVIDKLARKIATLCRNLPV